MDNQPTINKFIKGVNTDIAEDSLPAGFLSNGHNIKLTNNDNKQGIAQKQESYIKKLDGYGANLKPLAARVFNDVIYLVSFNTTGNYVEYGTYPSAETPLGAPTTVYNKVYKYAPLPNYLNIPFITANPPIFYSVPGFGASPLVTALTSSTGANWQYVSKDAGLGHSPSSGASGSNMTITVDDNYTQTPQTKVINVRSADGTLTTPVTIYQRLDPWILSTPAVYNDIANSGAPMRSPVITTYGPTWEVTDSDAGVNLIQSEGDSGVQLIVIIGDNPGAARTLEATVSTVELSPVSTVVQFNQLAAEPPTGSFSDNDLTAQTGTVHTVFVTYDPGSLGNGWNITKLSGAAAASFVPSTGVIGDTYVQTAATISGATGATAIYELKDAVGDLLDSLSVAIIANPPTVVVNTIYYVFDTSIDVDCTVTDDGGETVTARGICWSTSANPTIADSHTTDGTGTGAFTSLITGLTVDIGYHIRAYATNSQGTDYGADYFRTTVTPDIGTTPTVFYDVPWNPITLNVILDSTSEWQVRTPLPTGIMSVLPVNGLTTASTSIDIMVEANESGLTRVIDVYFELTGRPTVEQRVRINQLQM